MDLNASDGIQIGVGVVLALTLGAVLWYAWEARKQAKATDRMAEGVLRPVVVQWMKRSFPIAEGQAVTLAVRYQNIGSGPALNMHWSVMGADVAWSDTPERVGMGAREPEGKVGMRIMPPVGTPLVAVEYEDVSEGRWRSTLELVQREGELHNGEARIQSLDDEGAAT